jgi:hypothetical protein
VRHEDRGGGHAARREHAQRIEAREPARRQQRADEVAGRVGGVHRAGREVAPAQLGAHRRQQQRVRETGQAQRDGGRQREGEGKQQRCFGHPRLNIDHFRRE